MTLPASRASLTNEERARRRLVTQLTDNWTPVVCNSHKGQITMATPLDAGAGVEFTVTNNKASVTSHIYLSSQATAATAGVPLLHNIVTRAAGSFVVHVININGVATSTVPIIWFRIEPAL